MTTKPSDWQQYQQKVLQTNPKINSNTVAAHCKLEKKLEKLGVEIKPKFGLEPPLGGNRARFHNRNG